MTVNIQDEIRRFPRRKTGAHKGELGHAFIIAGSCGYTGAAYLASQAAVLAGSGLVTLAIAKSLYPVLASKLTEAMVRPFFETRDGSLSLMAEREIEAFSEKTDVLAVGPGISQNRETQGLTRNLAGKINKPMVIDADGIVALSGNLDALKAHPSARVLTPHPGEMARLTGTSVEEVQANRKDVALNFASLYNTVLVLKGHETVVAAPDGGLYINQTGNPGMAKGGTGDVLTGIIAAFIAQGCKEFTASVLGVYFHGLAGDLAVKEKGILGLVATDMLNKLPEALKILG